MELPRMTKMQREKINAKAALVFMDTPPFNFQPRKG
jgi:hypothetical protein